jgi:hypothetical protein
MGSGQRVPSAAERLYGDDEKKAIAGLPKNAYRLSEEKKQNGGSCPRVHLLFDILQTLLRTARKERKLRKDGRRTEHLGGVRARELAR